MVFLMVFEAAGLVSGLSLGNTSRFTDQMGDHATHEVSIKKINHP